MEIARVLTVGKAGLEMVDSEEEEEEEDEDEDEVELGAAVQLEG